MDLLRLFPDGTRWTTPDEVDARVFGTIHKPETLNYQTFRPEPGGMFDEEIFGELSIDGGTADEVDPASPIASRFGEIRLPVRLVHPLVWTRARSELASVSGWSAEELVGLLEGELVYELSTQEAIEVAGAHGPFLTGVAAVNATLDLRLDLTIDRVLMLPTATRPIRTANVNDHYRRVINRRNRLAQLIEQGAPDLILRHEEVQLFAAVVALFDNERLPSPTTNRDGEVLRSLMGFVTDEAVAQLNESWDTPMSMAALGAWRAIEAMGFTIDR